MPYSRFEQYLQEHRFADVHVGQTTIRGTLREPRDGKSVVVADRVDPDTADRLSRFGVAYGRLRESSWLTDLLLWVAPTLLFFGLWVLLNRRLAALERTRS